MPRRYKAQLTVLVLMSAGVIAAIFFSLRDNAGDSGPAKSSKIVKPVILHRPIDGARKYIDNSGRIIFEVTAKDPTEFPHAVAVTKGKTQFENGDSIVINEVRGTANQFALGNFYQIKGTYKLASHDKASLAAYVSATDTEDSTGYPHTSQSTAIYAGEGEFTLVCPFYCRGYPHLSLYAGGRSIGEIYFGTGAFVLK